MQDAQFQEAGLVGIWALGMIPQNRTKLLPYGAGEVIFQAIIAHSENPAVLEAAFAAIKNLSGDVFLHKYFSLVKIYYLII